MFFLTSGLLTGTLDWAGLAGPARVCALSLLSLLSIYSHDIENEAPLGSRGGAACGGAGRGGSLRVLEYVEKHACRLKI